MRSNTDTNGILIALNNDLYSKLLEKVGIKIDF